MKNFEIGSDFYFSSEQLKEEKDFLESSFNNEILSDDNNKRLVFSGRKAIDIVLRDIKYDLKIKKIKALIPAYTCQTVIQPFLDNNFELYYYNTDINLNIKISEINELIKKYDIDVVLLLPLFGFNTIIVDEKIISGIVILDDTQGYFSKSNIDFQDYTIVSLRKWFGIPDGALIIKTKGNLDFELKEVEEDFIKKAKDAYISKYNYLFFDNIEKEEFRKKYQELKEELSNKKEDFAISNLTKTLILKEDFEYLKSQRRENFNTLLEYFNNKELGFNENEIKLVFKQLPDEVVPLYFPIYTIGIERNEFQKYMGENKIFCPIIWPLPDNLDKDKINDTTKWLYKHMIVISIDQRYSKEDMEYIIEVLEKMRVK